MKRPAELEPAPATHVRVDALVPTEGGPPKLVSTSADLPIDGSPIELTWTGEAW
jgi:hypothetical protein